MQSRTHVAGTLPLEIDNDER